MGIPCEKADKIDAIEKRISKIENVLDDNGQPGLRTLALKTCQKVDDLMDVIKSMKIATDGLLLFQERVQFHVDHKKERRERRNLNIRWTIALLASIGLGILALILK